MAEIQQHAEDRGLAVEPPFEPFDFERLRREQSAALDRLLEQWARNFWLDHANNFLRRGGGEER